MQEVKFLLREVGEGGMSSAELEEYIANNFTSKGYKLFSQAPFPVTKDGKIKSVQLFMTFAKDEEACCSEGGPEVVPSEAPKKRGRPVKAE
jgi:hypothetical protein